MIVIAVRLQVDAPTARLMATGALVNMPLA